MKRGAFGPPDHTRGTGLSRPVWVPRLSGPVASGPGTLLLSEFQLREKSIKISGGKTLEPDLFLGFFLIGFNNR